MYAQICILERMCYINRVACNAPVSQLVEETASKSVQCGFESHRGHRFGVIPIHWNGAVFVMTAGSSDCFAVSCSYPFVSLCDPLRMEKRGRNVARNGGYGVIGHNVCLRSSVPRITAPTCRCHVILQHVAIVCALLVGQPCENRPVWKRGRQDSRHGWSLSDRRSALQCVFLARFLSARTHSQATAAANTSTAIRSGMKPAHAVLRRHFFISHC